MSETTDLLGGATAKKRPGKWDAQFADMQRAIDRRTEFMARVIESCGDVARLADMMAEAIDMQIEANGKEVVGRDGRAFVCMDEIAAAHCLIAARDAYRLAREVGGFATGTPIQHNTPIRD